VSRAVIQPDVDAALAGACEYSQEVDLGPLLVLDGRNLVDMHLRDCHFSGASFRQAHGVDLDLIGSTLFDADFEGAALGSAEFADADLRSANFGDASLVGAGLLSADLREADLRAADLSGADLAEADLQLGFADSRTTWPDGFVPEAAGVILVDRPARHSYVRRRRPASLRISTPKPRAFRFPGVPGRFTRSALGLRSDGRHLTNQQGQRALCGRGRPAGARHGRARRCVIFTNMPHNITFLRRSTCIPVRDHLLSGSSAE
jgi:hypothetical protein